MVQPKILCVDDDAFLLEMCREILQDNGFRCKTTEDSSLIPDLLKSYKPDLVLSDLQMPGKDGMDVLRDVRQLRPDTPVIIMTAHGSIESAVKAVQEGATDYVPKPFRPDELCMRIQKALDHQELTRENRDLKQHLVRHQVNAEMVGNSRAMQQIHARIDRAAPTDASVLILGESGTGKELIARILHRKSLRTDAPFVPVDCVAIADTLFESELFGHKKGAFTGATEDREGLFETANGGTLFLDEITEINIELQGKLLRVLQERQFRRVGGRELHDLNVRILAATNRIPSEAVADNKLREDLYYRLNVIPIELPPLRERGEDVLQLIDHFLHRYCEANNRNIRNIHKDALDALLRYRWPGNVRELQNMMERLVILAPGDEIMVNDLPDSVLRNQGFGGIGGAGSFTDPELLEMSFKDAKNRVIEEFEMAYLNSRLRKHNGNISATARDIGVDRKTIHRQLKAYGLDI